MQRFYVKVKVICLTGNMPFTVLKYLILFAFFSQFFTFRILFLPPAISPSHRLIIRPWAENLVARGHDIWIFGPVEGLDSSISKFQANGAKIRLFSISKQRLRSFPANSSGNRLKDFLKFLRNLWIFIKMIIFGPVFMPESAGFYQSLPICGEFITSFTQEIDAIVSQRWDLVVIDEIFNPCGWEIANRIEAPKAMLSTTLLRAHLSFLYPQAAPISFFNIWPDVDYSNRKVFVARSGSVWSLTKFWFQNIDAWSLAIEIRNWIDLRRNVSLIFSYFPHRLDFPRPLSDAVIDMSGITAENDICPNNIAEDFILVSLGNWISKRRMLLTVILQALQIVSSRIKVLMWLPDSANNEITLKFGSSSFEIHTALPQKKLLACDRCRLLVTHGGGSSLQEAIASGIPMLGIPLFGDQHANLARLQRFVPVQILKSNEITVGALVAAISQILLNDSSYKLRMETLKEWFSKRIVLPKEQTVFWTLRLAAGKFQPRISANLIGWSTETFLCSLICILFLSTSILLIVI